MIKTGTLKPWLWVILLAGSGACVAADPQFSGYLSQGVIYSDDNPFYDDDTGTNFNLRELGLNISWQATERLRLAGQLNSRKAGDLDDGDPNIDFLLLDYQYLVTETARAGVRLGRVKNQYGLYNTTRDVPHGRPGVFVPQSVYFDSMRGALLSSDGVNFYLNLSTDMADIGFSVQSGQEHLDNNAIEYQLFQKNNPGEVDKINFDGLKITVEPTAIPELTAAVTVVDLAFDYDDYPPLSIDQITTAATVVAADPSLITSFITHQKLAIFMQLYSMQYAWSDWILTAEYLTIDIDIEDLNVLYFPLNAPSETLVGGYAQLEWLASNRLSAYARYEELYYRVSDKDGKDHARVTGGNPVSQYAKVLTLGARWYFTPDFSLTAEYSTNEGAAFINGQSEADYPRLKEDWDMFLLQMSYHF